MCVCVCVCVCVCACVRVRVCSSAVCAYMLVDQRLAVTSAWLRPSACSKATSNGILMVGEWLGGLPRAAVDETNC